MRESFWKTTVKKCSGCGGDVIVSNEKHEVVDCAACNPKKYELIDRMATIAMKVCEADLLGQQGKEQGK